jgi:hypothetical protein
MVRPCIEERLALVIPRKTLQPPEGVENEGKVGKGEKGKTQ